MLTTVADAVVVGLGYVRRGGGHVLNWLAAVAIGCGGAGRGAPPAAVGDEVPVEDPTAGSALELAFDPVGMPDDLGTLEVPVAAASVRVDGVAHALKYTVLRRTGDDGFGQLYDRTMTPLADDGMCNEQDFNSILTVDGQPFMVSHFECTPGSMAVSRLDQADDGTLSIASSTPVDFASVGGLWNPCAGQVSPWNTHLGSEEYEPDARREPTPAQYWPHRSWNAMKRYQTTPLDPYRSGWTPEVRILDAAGTVEVRKYLSPGRASHEIAYVLPDQRTVYLSDDGTAVGWYLFVADTAAELSAGHLYAARFTQQEGGVLGIGWVPLGHSSDAELQPLLEAGLSFDQLFEVAEPADGACGEGFRFVRHSYGEECLKLAAPSAAVPDPAMAASRFEKRRYAGFMGASLELEKGEGVTYDPDAGRVYLAVSKITKTMTDDAGDVRLPSNGCGVVYGGPTASGVVDTAGTPIPSEHVMTALEPDVVGRPTADGKACAADGIANPDNITFLPGYRQLIVAEDTSKHANAFLWSFGADGVGTKVMVAPPYGEFTGVHWIPDVGGFGYLTVTVQHPWSEGADSLPDGISADATRTFTGVLGPFPKLTGAR